MRRPAALPRPASVGAAAGGGAEVLLAEAAGQAASHTWAALCALLPTPVALVCGPEFVFAYANPCYLELIGGRPVVGRKFAEGLPELRADDYPLLLARVLQTGERHTEKGRQVSYVRTPGGEPEERYIDFGFDRVLDADGRPYGVLIHVVDVTDQLRAQRQLADGVRARDDFLSFCSHELKTPLAGLKMSAQNLQRRLQKGEAAADFAVRLLQLLAQWDETIGRMVRLIDDMADFSRINRGTLVLRRTPCGLDKLVAEVLARLKPQAQAAGVVLTASLQPAPGHWDGLRLEQLCTNLVTNALKYGGGRPVHVEVADCDDSALLRVRDHGQGIAPADLERIFLPYERASNAHESGSLGVGLFISRRIVEAHGGRLDAVSELGRGTTFVVVLPKDVEQPPA